MFRSKRPTRRLENKLISQGFKHIAGLDEAGRGAWAGPLVAAAVILPPDFKVKGLRDSKLLSPRQREDLFVAISKNALQYSVSIVSHQVIDKIGLQQANIRAFRQAISKLKLKPDYLLLDGREIQAHPVPYEYIIKGDALVSSIAAASILAKVTRDQIMSQHHTAYPEYGFAAHKGYGTFAHLKALRGLGPCSIHRRTFKPLRQVYA